MHLSLFVPAEIMAATNLTAGTSPDSPGPIYGAQLVKYWPLVTQKDVPVPAIQLPALLVPPLLLLARLLQGMAPVCAPSSSDTPSPPPTSLGALCHSAPQFSSWQMGCCSSAGFVPWLAPSWHPNCNGLCSFVHQNPLGLWSLGLCWEQTSSSSLP